MITEDQDASPSPARAQFGGGRRHLPSNRQSNRGASKLELALSPAESGVNKFLIVTFCHPVFSAGRAAQHIQKGRADAGPTCSTARLFSSSNLCTGLVLRNVGPVPPPAAKRATQRTRSSITEHSFQGITPSLKGKSVTHVSGTNCHPCRSAKFMLIRPDLTHRVFRPGQFKCV